MKKTNLKTLSLLIFTTLTLATKAQVLCIECYDQNAPVLTNTNNLIVNGGFENSNCVVNVQSSVFCPNSNYYSCNIPNWTCTGGGYLTYAHIVGPAWVGIGEGTKAAYLGNHYV